MKSFDDYFNENFEDGLSSPSKYILRHAFESGARSRQAEVDELKTVVEGWKEEYRIMALRYENLKGENHE